MGIHSFLRYLRCLLFKVFFICENQRNLRTTSPELTCKSVAGFADQLRCSLQRAIMEGVDLNSKTIVQRDNVNMPEQTRRTFLAKSTQSSLAVATGAVLAAGAVPAQAKGPDTKAAQPQSQGNPLAIFTKSFQDRPIPEVCRIFKRIGADGLDLTVRPGGHIDPKDVVKELPPAVQDARDAGLKVHFLTTSITEADETARTLLATAADLGIDRVKLGYFRYKKFGQMQQEIDAVKKRIEGIAKLAKKLGVLPCVHIHSGNFIPSHGTHLYELIKDFDPQQVGAYVDPQHMTKEGGVDGWRQGLDLLAPWIALSSMKNFVWEKTKRDERGQQRWRTINVPVADGIAPVPDFIASLHKLGYHGVISMHSEYKGGHSFKSLDTDGCIEQTAKDIQFVRQFV
jgi:sugar phosphate isomerase/epimerase